MAKVHFRNAALNRYGLPQACVCCGSDEDDLGSQPVTVSHMAMLAACLFVFMGVIGWLLLLVFGLYQFAQWDQVRKQHLRLPVCALCHKARRFLNLRTGKFMLIIIGIACLLSAASPLSWAGKAILWVVFVLFICYMIFERLNYLSSFTIVPGSIDRDKCGCVVNVPYEDYPALYQRHLDNALLYDEDLKSDSIG